MAGCRTAHRSEAERQPGIRRRPSAKTCLVGAGAAAAYYGATAPYYGGSPYYGARAPYAYGGNPAQNSFVCQPGTMVRLDDGRMYPCQ